MSIVNQFVCTKVRFAFFNGRKIYTVEYTPGLHMWFVFDEDMETNCLAKYELGKKEKAILSQDAAWAYLDRYLNP